MSFVCIFVALMSSAYLFQSCLGLKFDVNKITRHSLGDNNSGDLNLTMSNDNSTNFLYKIQVEVGDPPQSAPFIIS